LISESAWEEMTCLFAPSLSEILHSLDKLRKDGLLLTPDKRSFLELNMARISEIKAILGRNF
ncbi:hypothetical protein QJN85_25415, partial [Escherichia coli]